MATASQYIRTSYTLSGLPPGKRGTEKTLCEMAKFVRTAVALPFFVDHARNIASQVPAHNQRGQVKKIFEHVSQCMYYINDPVDVEWVQGAQHTEFESGFGDCDDAAVLIASLCGAIGVVCQFIVCGFDPSDNSYDHVWAQAWIEPSEFDRGGWYDLDPCADPRTGNNVPGYYAKNATNFAIFPVWPELTSGLGDEGYDSSGDSFDASGWDFSGDPSGGGSDGSGDTGSGTSDPLDFSQYGAIGDADQYGQIIDNGLEMFTNADGSVDIYSPDGSYESWDSDGNVTSYSTVNADGTITYFDVQNGTSYTENPYGNVISQQAATPTQKAQAQAKQAAGPGGGGGGGIPLGSSGGQKAQTPAASTNPTANTVASLLNKASNAIQSLFGAGNQAGLHTAINPATGQPVLVNSAGQIVGTPGGASTTGLSGTTLLLLALGAAFLLKGK